MTVVRELVTLLGFEVDDKALKSAEDSFGTLQSMAKAVVLGVGAVTGAMAALAISTGDYADDISKTATALNVSTTALQGLEYAASTARVKHEELRVSLRALAKNVGEVALRNVEMVKTFRILGVSIYDTQGQTKPLEVIFSDVADALSRIPSSAKRTALALKVMEEGGAKLMPLMLQGSDGIASLVAQAGELGLIMSDADVRAGEQFAREWSMSRFQLQALARTIGVQVLPYARELLAWLRDLGAANVGLIAQNASEGFRSFARAVRAVWYVVSRVGGPMLTLLRRLADLKTYAMLAAGALGLTMAMAVGKSVTAFSKFIMTSGGVLKMLRSLSLGPLVVGLKWLALAGILALVWDDVATFMRGGQSVLGDLTEAMTRPIDPNDTWPVKVLKMVGSLTKDAAEGLASLLQQLGIIENHQVGNINIPINQLPGYTPRPSTVFQGPRMPIERGLGPQGSAALARGFSDANFGAGDGMRLINAAGEDVASANLARSGRGGMATTVNAPIQVRVDASGQTDPAAIGAEVARATGAVVRDTMQAELDRAQLGQDGTVR